MTQEQTAEEKFGAQVREARELREWTQEQLRRQLRESSGIDLSSTAMARLEQGKRPIRLNEVAALSRLLGLDLQAYSGGVPQLTDDEYAQAHESLERAWEQEREARRFLAQVREKNADEELAAEQDVALFAGQRKRIEAAIRAYEERQRG